MRTISVERLADYALALPVLQAWRAFKRNHDVADAKVCCCEHTLKLFQALDELEMEILDNPARVE